MEAPVRSRNRSPHRLGALTLEIWRSRNNAEEPVLAGLFQDCERLALEGDRPRELDICKPASQAMGEGALRSFYRRAAALGDAAR